MILAQIFLQLHPAFSFPFYLPVSIVTTVHLQLGLIRRRPVIVNESTSMQSPPVASNNSKLQTNVKTPPQVHSRRPEMRAYSHACVHRGTWIRSVMRSSAASRWAWTRRRPGIPIDGAVDRSCTSPTYTYSTSVRALWVQAGRAHASTQLLAPNPHLDMDV